MRDVTTDVVTITVRDMAGMVRHFPIVGGSDVEISRHGGELRIQVRGTTRGVPVPVRCPASHVWSGVPYRCALVGPHDVHSSSSVIAGGITWRDDT